MSKNQLRSRIESLFSDLEEEASELTSTPSREKAIEGSDLSSGGWQWEADREGCYQYIGLEVETILGRSVSEFIGQPVRIYALTPDSTPLITSAIRVLTSRRFGDSEVSFRTPEVEPVEVDVAFVDQGGELVPVRFSIALLTQKPTGGKPDDGQIWFGWYGSARVIEGSSEPQGQPEALGTSESSVEEDGFSIGAEKIDKVVREQTSSQQSQKADVIERDFQEPMSIVNPQDIQSAPAQSMPLPVGRQIRLPRGVRVEDDQVTSPDSFLTDIASESLQKLSPVYHPGGKENPASIAIPLKFQEETGALLEILDDHPGRIWTEYEQRLVEQVADQLSLALENARLFQETQNALAQTETLYSITQSAARSLELEASLEEMLRQLLLAIGFETGMVCLVNEVTWRLELAVQLLLPEKILSEINENGLTNSLPSLVFQWGTSLTVPDFHQGAPVDVTSWIEEGFNSFLGVPLESKGRTLGVLCAFHQRSWSGDSSSLSLMQVASQQIGIAVENARLFQQTQSRAEEMEILHSVSLELAQQTRQLDAVLSIVMQRSMELLNSDGGSIWLWNELENVLELMVTPIEANQSWIGRKLQINQETGSDKSLVLQAFKEGTLQVVNDYRTWSGQTATYEEIPFEAALAVPLKWQEGVVGVLVNTRSNAHDPFSVNEQALIELLASQAAAIIQNTRLYQEEQNRRQVADTLREIARVVGSTLDVREVSERVLDRLEKLVQFQSASIQLVHQGRRQVIGSRGVNPVKMDSGSGDIWHPIEDDALLVEVIQTRQPLLVSDTILDDRWPNPTLTTNVRSWLAAPMVAGQSVVGLLVLSHSNPGVYTNETLDFINAVASQAAVAIQNARLFEQTQYALAETDALYQASAELNAAADFEAVLHVIRRHTIAGQGAIDVTLNLFDPIWQPNRSPDWIDVLARWSQLPLDALVNRYPFGRFPSATQLLTSDSPVIIENVADDPRLDADTRKMIRKRLHGESTIFIPMVVGGRFIGFVSAIFPTPTTFPDKEIRRLSVLAGQAAVAVQNLRNLQVAELRAKEAQQRSEELGLINRVVSAMVSSPELTDVLDAVASELIDLFNLGSVEIALFDGDRRQLTVVAEKIRDVLVKPVLGEKIPVDGNPSLEHVIATRQPLVITDAQTSTLLSDQHQDLVKRDVQTMALFPIIVGGEVIGTINLEYIKTGKQFNDHDLSIAKTLVNQISTGIQNANLYDQTQIALAETATLYQASAMLNSAHDYNDILGILRRSTILGHEHASNVNISLFEHPWTQENEPEWYMPIARWSSSATWNPLDSRYPMSSWTTAKDLLRNDAPTIIEDAESDPRLDNTAREVYVDRMSAKSLLFVPLTVGGQWIGHISAVYDRSTTISPSDGRPLMALASQAAVAIENIRLLQETRRRATQLETAAEIARDTSSTLALETLLDRAVNLICNRYGYHHASIFLLDEVGFNAVVRASTGEAGIEMQQRAYALPVGSQSVIGYVTEKGTPLVINDVSLNPIHRPNPFLPGTQSEMAIPFKIGERIIGALDVQSNEIDAFLSDDVVVLQALADQIAVAVDNARSYELAQEAVSETRQRVQELSTLFNVSQSLASASLEMEEISAIIAEQMAEIANVQSSFIALSSQDGESLEIVAEFGKHAANKSSRKGQKLNLDALSVLKKVMHTLQPVVLYAGDSGNNAQEETYLRTSQISVMLLIPLAVKGQAIGLVELRIDDSPSMVRRFTLEQLNLIMTVANAAAVTLENARLYTEQRETAEQLREVDKLKSQFLANMSHELRTPLNSIIGFSRVILKGIDGPVNEVQTQDLNAIHSAGQHLLQLINDILDISKIEAGKMELSFDDDVNLADLINSAMSTAVGLTKDKPIKLERSIPDDLPLVRADSTRIRQVLINFLSNASKFTDIGTITVKAEVVISPNNQQEVMVSVIDTGPGISEEDQKKLFQPFSQVDSSPTRKVGGSGLGLSISRLLVDLHGGRIGLFSKVGQGSTFYFTLPLYKRGSGQGYFDGDGRTILAIDDDRQIISLYERYLSNYGYEVVPLTDPFLAVETAKQIKPFAITLDVMMPRKDGWQVLEALKADPKTRNIPVIVCSIVENLEKGFSLGATDYLMKPILEEDLVSSLNRLNGDGSIHDVLVIDDDMDDLRLVQKILEDKTQYQVRVAHGGPEGLVAIQTNPPHAIILDLFMPELDGFALLEMLKAESKLRNIPVLIFTAGDLTEDQQEMLAEFTQHMLRKAAFKEEELLLGIEKALERLNPI